MILPITLAVLTAQLALADQSEPADGIPARRRGVQIGAAAPVRSTDAYHPLPLLDSRLSMQLRDGSVQDFFVEVSSKTKLEFILVHGIGDCRMSAFLKDVSAREALQAMLPGRISYQQLGRSNSYTIVPRYPGKAECPRRPQAVGTGQCTDGSTPISIKCKDGKLSAFAELLANQSGASIAVWDDAGDFPISINLSKVRLEKAIKKVGKNKQLEITRLGTKTFFTFALKRTNETSELDSVQVSTRVISITPSGVQEYFSPGKRKEPEANPVFKQGMPN